MIPPFPSILKPNNQREEQIPSLDGCHNYADILLLLMLLNNNVA